MNLPAKGRAIAIPVDLDNQVNNLFVKSNNIVQKTAMSWRLSARNASRRDSVQTASRDYRNIIERLQVYFFLPVFICVCSFVQTLSEPLCLGCRTLCQRLRTGCDRWSRLSCRFWWTCCIGLSCSSLRTRTHVGSVRVEASYASEHMHILYQILLMPSHLLSLTCFSLLVRNKICEQMCLCRLIKHTKQLLEENEERLCIKVLQTLREMMTKDRGYGEKVGEAAKLRQSPFP